MNADYNIAIVSVVKMIVDNNAGCVSRKLKEIGYETKKYIPATELEYALLQLHTANRDKFFEIMNKCEWNNGNSNWTNDSKYKSQIMSAVELYTGKTVDKTNWWKTTMNYLMSQQTN